MSRPQVFIVCYDITSDSRRNRVYRLLRGYGEHIQYSVFRCVLSDIQREQLAQELRGHIDNDGDQVLLMPIGPADDDRSWSAIALGRDLPRQDRVVWIL